MYFNPYPDIYSRSCKLFRDKPSRPSMHRVYSHFINTHGERRFKDELLARAEIEWWQAGRPYYNVWPAATDCLLSFNPDRVELASLADAQERIVAVQFPRGGSTVNHSALVAMLRPEETGTGMFCLLTCEVQNGDLVAVNALYATPGATIGDDVPQGLNSTPTSIQRMAYALLLMEKDPSLFEADILARDAEKYAVAGEMERREIEDTAAHVRGQRGWHLGRTWETIPHFRRPHPALVWTGQGRTIPKVVLRSGCVVKRHKLTEAPTGFHGSLGEAECDTASV